MEDKKICTFEKFIAAKKLGLGILKLNGDSVEINYDNLKVY